MHTHAAKVWDLSRRSRAILCRAVPTLRVTIRHTCASLHSLTAARLTEALFAAGPPLPAVARAEYSVTWADDEAFYDADPFEHDTYSAQQFLRPHTGVPLDQSVTVSSRRRTKCFTRAPVALLDLPALR
jgi:hypothetical protein